MQTFNKMKIEHPKNTYCFYFPSFSTSLDYYRERKTMPMAIIGKHKRSKRSKRIYHCFGG